MSQPRVSIIVPVYKVEKYLDRCIQSLIHQTLKDIEIILVDDGSPDNCPAMCNEYAKQDSRIKVVHKKNGGLSDARNFGIDAAKADFLAFVDSDDYIDSKMIENLLDGINRDHTDIEACKIYSVTGDKVTEYDRDGNRLKDKFPIMTGMEYLKHYIAGEIENATWNKLYRKSCFDNVKFKVGRNNEDYLMFYDLCPKIKSIGFIDYFGYYYVQREGSIVHDKNQFLYFDIIKNIEEIRSDIYKNHPELKADIDKKECQERIIFMKAVLMRQRYLKYRKEFGKNFRFLWHKPNSFKKQLPPNFQTPFMVLKYFPFLYTLKSCLKKNTL